MAALPEWVGKEWATARGDGSVIKARREPASVPSSAGAREWPYRKCRLVDTHIMIQGSAARVYLGESPDSGESPATLQLSHHMMRRTASGGAAAGKGTHHAHAS